VAVNIDVHVSGAPSALFHLEIINRSNIQISATIGASFLTDEGFV
jgi:hypothetical protein